MEELTLEQIQMRQDLKGRHVSKFYLATNVGIIRRASKEGNNEKI